MSATELRAMPLPELDTIVHLGERALQTMNSEEKIDQIVEEALLLDIHEMGVC